MITFSKELTMIDISEYGFQFRGYPVTVASGGVMAMISGPEHDPAREIARILRGARDSAGAGEPSGWIFCSPLGGGRTVCVERFGGIRDLDQDRHEDGQWSIYLPSER
jgi:hypothetical protein